MISEKTIGVVVPAYNEGKLINKTLETMPEFVDTIIAVNDGSKDDTRDRILNCQKVILGLFFMIMRKTKD